MKRTLIRTSTLLTAVATFLAPLAATASTPSPTPLPSTPAEALAAAQSELASLQASAAAATDRLTATTQAVLGEQTALSRAQDAATSAHAAAERADAAAAAAQGRLDSYAAATYQSPSSSTFTLIFSSSDISQTLQSMSYLQVAGQSAAGAAQDATDAKAAAKAARASASDAEARAQKDAADAATALSAARADATSAATALTAGLARLQSAQGLVDAFNAAGIPLTTTGCVDTNQVLTLPTSPSWGGFPDGLIPASSLCPIRVGQLLRLDAAIAFHRLDVAYTQAFNTPLCVTQAYRSYADQVAVYAAKPSLAAIPGTSNHGWGLAVDLCGGIESFSSAQHVWMVQHAAQFGWFHPSWAEPGSSRPEPWHWEFGHIS